MGEKLRAMLIENTHSSEGTIGSSKAPQKKSFGMKRCKLDKFHQNLKHILLMRMNIKYWRLNGRLMPLY
jgi:hypothetical protein